MRTVKEILSSIAPLISFSEISTSYLHKNRSWLANKINENVINNVHYHLNREEVDKLSEILSDLSKRINETSKQLKEYSLKLKRQEGSFYTMNNPFKNTLFKEWYKLIEQPTSVVEPFAGSCNIPVLLKEIGIKPKWKCYDITPVHNKDYHVIKRDCLINMPDGKVIITNPPYLAKNSAMKNGLNYPNTPYQDLYLYCLELMLRKARYVAAIIPESFITSNLFHDRLFGVISLKDNYFVDTQCPVCLAMFVPGKTESFKIYSSDDYVGDYKTIISSTTFTVPTNSIKWKFNAPDGQIGVQCIDGKRDLIRFFPGEIINSNRIVGTSRHYTRIDGLPETIDRDSFISICNSILTEYREKTHDILLTSFRGKRADGNYRRRIDYGTVKAVMNTALTHFHF
ncbi:MAG: DUF5053 domain-containing protein [Bacteroidaceae bacterium]|nr:DUF5053 domain-containing protein [Bacteroidaceae bacterium]